MPLINFKTNLTSLKFGADRPGGGDSGQPFIQSPIETANTPGDIKRIYELNRTSLDYPIRGGAISSLVTGTYTTNAAITDTERIKKFFKSAPQGKAFIEKQKGLQLTNPKTQVANTLQFVGLSLGNAVIDTTQTYNPANTIAQVAVQGTGAHFNRQGVGPNIYESPKQTYQYIAGAPQNNTEATNRLSILRALKLVGNDNFLVSSDVVYGIGIDPYLVDKLGISSVQSQLFNYPGGPGSTYGDGFTRIFRATNTQGAPLTSQPLVNPITTIPYSTMAFTYQKLAEQENYRGWNNAFPGIQDFRAQLATDGHNPQVAASDYEQYSTINRLGIGSPGAYDLRLQYNDISKAVAEDSVNMINPLFFNPSGADPWTAAYDAGESPADMIKFVFECVSNDSDTAATAGANQSAALIFRAFLEGQISDTNQASYNSFRYLGRGETFRTYQGFDRGITFTFKVFAQTRQEMRPLYKKLNWLISQVYPDYSPSSNLMRGNVVKLTIGDYIYRMPGFLENVNVTIDNTNTPWEILLNEYSENDVRQLPHMVTVQCSFKPIMDLLPRRENYLNQFVPLIANRDHYLDPNPPVRGKLDTSIVTVSKPTLEAPSAPQTFNGAAPTVAPNIAPQQTIPKENPKQDNAAKPKKGKGLTIPNPTIDKNLFKTSTTTRDNTTYSPANAGGTYKAGGG